jgi:hypothetical protein
MSEQNQLSPDWVAELEGETVNCEDVTIRLSTSLPIVEGCLNVTCIQCENGKSISPIDSAQPTMAHDADTDSDLARPLDGKHPSARNATPAMILRSATRRRGCRAAARWAFLLRRVEDTMFCHLRAAVRQSASAGCWRVPPTALYGLPPALEPDHNLPYVYNPSHEPNTYTCSPLWRIHSQPGRAALILSAAIY